MAKDRYLERIITDPEILVGKPVVKGTRIPVGLVLEYLANNPNFDDLFADYPRLTMDDVKACLAYAKAMIEDGGKFKSRAKDLHAMQRLAALVSEYDSVRAKPRLRRRRLSRLATLEDFPARMSEG